MRSDRPKTILCLPQSNANGSWGSRQKKNHGSREHNEQTADQGNLRIDDLWEKSGNETRHHGDYNECGEDFIALAHAGIVPVTMKVAASTTGLSQNLHNPVLPTTRFSSHVNVAGVKQSRSTSESCESSGVPFLPRPPVLAEPDHLRRRPLWRVVGIERRPFPIEIPHPQADFRVRRERVR